MAIHPVTFANDPSLYRLCSAHLASMHATGSIFDGDPEGGALFAVDATVGPGDTSADHECDACTSTTAPCPTLDTSAADTLKRARDLLWPEGGEVTEWDSGTLDELAAILDPAQ